MKFTSLVCLIFVIAAFAVVSANPAPFNLGKELEGIGQRVRDAIIKAKPAVDTIADVQRIIQGGDRRD